jgi:ATP-dependent Clp protease ATP-binding subunit ClpA
MAGVSRQLDPRRTGEQAAKLDADLHRRIVGQDEAIAEVISVYQTHLAGLSGPGKPVGSFLFLGPTGSGKTRLVEAAAESLLGDSRAVIKIDCAEFQHSHEIAKLIGSPPGYLGHRETHPLLSQEVLNQYHTEQFKLSFVLFDEIEKASDALWNLLLGILDKATLTLGDNRRVDFSRTIIFLTSNLGAMEMSSLLRPNLGFAAGEQQRQTASGVVDESLSSKVDRSGLAAARRKFTPEFMNRIDKTVVFHPLGTTELRKILDIELDLVHQRIQGATPFDFHLSEDAKDFLLREGTDVKYGARHLKRAVDRYLVHPISNLLATGQVRIGDSVGVDYDVACEGLTFFKEAEEAPAYRIAHADSALRSAAGALAAEASADLHKLSVTAKQRSGK